MTRKVEKEYTYGNQEIGIKAHLKMIIGMVMVK
jgi:hypothetical protein